MTLERLHQCALNFLRNFYDRHEELPATFFALDRDDRVHVMVGPFYAEKRDLYEMLVRAYFILHGVTAYAVAAEAWAAVQSSAASHVDSAGRLYSDVLPSEDPNRFEVLNTCAVGRHGIVGRAFRIVREKGKRPRIGEEIREMRPPIDAPRVGLFALLDHLVPAPGAEEAFAKVLPRAMPIYFPKIAIMREEDLE